MKTINIILLIIIIVGLGIYLATHTSLKSYSTEDKSKFVKIFERFDKNSIDKIEVRRLNSLTTLVSENSKWIVADSVPFPADEDNVNKLLNDLDSIEILDICSTNPKSHFKMKVDTLQGAHFTLFQGKDTVMDIIIGGFAGYGSTYIRPAKSSNVYESKGMLIRYSSITDWRNKTIAKVPLMKIKSFDYNSPDVSYSIDKVDSGWQITDNKTDETFLGDSARVASILKPLGKFNASTVADLPKDTIGTKFDKPVYHTTITTNDGKRISFSAYAMKDNENMFIIKNDTGSIYYRAYKGILEQFARKDLSSLKKTKLAQNLPNNASSISNPPGPPNLKSIAVNPKVKTITPKMKNVNSKVKVGNTKVTKRKTK
ncbi:DUF4340 domain-containing protein [bacterium]|nr:DUF4340 domain-containing protein [bacterium]